MNIIISIDLHKNVSRHNNTLYCIVLYLNISKAPLTVLAIQRRSQRARPEEIEMSLDSEKGWSGRQPITQTESVGEGYSTKRDPQLQKHGAEWWQSWHGEQKGQIDPRSGGNEGRLQRPVYKHDHICTWESDLDWLWTPTRVF